MNTDTPLLRDNHGNAREAPAMTPYVLLLFGSALVCLFVSFAFSPPEAQELSPADTERPGPQTKHTPTEETE